jgi:hypothetical protein
MKHLTGWPSQLSKLSGDILLLVLTCFLAINIATDPISGPLRGCVWIICFISSYISPLNSLAFLIGTAACWDIPLLRLGYPNQFLTDVMTLGFAGGFLFNFSQRENVYTDSGNQKNLSKILDSWSDPIKTWAYLCFSLVAAFLITSTQELASISAAGFSFKNFILTIGERGFDWAIEGHLISRYGPIIGLGTLIILSKNLDKAKNNDPDRRFPRLVILSIIFGSTVNFAYAIAQLFEVSMAPRIYTIDIGGLTQNGNHLSYAGLLTLVTVLYGLMDIQTRISSHILFRFLIILIGIISGLGMLLIGYGRASWVGVVSGTIIGCIFYIIKAGAPRRLFIGLISFFGLLIILSFGLLYGGAANKISGTYSIANAEIFEILKNPSFGRIFSAGGRSDHYLAAWSDFLNNFWVGIGYDGFFARHPFFLEIHSLPLKLLAECGILGGLAFLGIVFSILTISVRGIRHGQTTASSKLAISVGGIWAISIPILADALLSFRGLATMALGIMFLQIGQILDELTTNPPKNSEAKSFLPIGANLKTISFLGFLAAFTLSKFFGAQTIPILTKGYPTEKDDQHSFNWRGLITELPFGQKLETWPQCIDIPFQSPVRIGQYSITFARLSRDTFESFTTRNLTRAKTNFAGGQSLDLEFKAVTPQWQSLCVCLKSPLNSLVPTMLIKNGDIISLAKNRPNKDLRFITLGVGGILSRPPIYDSSSCAEL